MKISIAHPEPEIDRFPNYFILVTDSIIKENPGRQSVDRILIPKGQCLQIPGDLAMLTTEALVAWERALGVPLKSIHVFLGGL